MPYKSISALPDNVREASAHRVAWSAVRNR